jgi:hypothetical protein
MNKAELAEFAETLDGIGFEIMNLEDDIRVITVKLRRFYKRRNYPVLEKNQSESASESEM